MNLNNSDNPFCGIALVTIAGEIMETNPKLAMIFGYDVKQILGLFFHDLIVLEHQKKSSHLFALIQVEKSYAATFKQKSGATISGRIQKSAIINTSKGSFHQLYVLPANALITNNFALDQTLNYELALRSAQAGTLYFDAKKNHLTWDKRSKEIFEVDESTFDNTIASWTKLLHPEDLAGIENQVSHAFTNDEYISLHYRIITPNHTIKYIWAVSYVIRDTDGEVMALTGLHFDETQKRKTEENLKTSNEELANFASIVAHDIKNPLHTLYGLTHLIKEEITPSATESTKEYFDLFEETFENITNIINGVLRHAKIGHVTLKTTVNLNEIVKTTLNGIQKLIEDHQAQITFDSLPIVIGYPVELTILFQNLISNAITYKKAHEKPVIHISAINKHTIWQVKISDNGIGIPKDKQQHIFTMFQRIDENGDGSGIGLATCKKIVENHGGTIGLQSTVKKGSVFHFTLPNLMGEGSKPIHSVTPS